MTDYAPLNIKQDTKDRLYEHKQYPEQTQDALVNHVLDVVEHLMSAAEETPNDDPQQVIDAGVACLNGNGSDYAPKIGVEDLPQSDPIDDLLGATSADIKELHSRLDTLQSGVEEATRAAQNAEKSVEELKQ